MKTWFLPASRTSTILGVLAAVLFVVAVTQACVIHSLRSDGFQAGDSGARPITGMSYQFSTQTGSQGPTYLVTMAVKGSRSYTMPVLFLQGGRAVQVPQTDAAAITDQWVKARAVGLAQTYARMDSTHKPYLPIDVERPGAP